MSTTAFATEAAIQDRRRSERSSQNISAWISGEACDTGAQGGNVRVQDLSLHGLGFISSKPYRPGAAHWLVVSHPQMRVSSRVRIISCRGDTDGEGYFVGAAFF